MSEQMLDLVALSLPPAWTVEALCAQVDHDGFFPAKGVSSNDAKRTCAMCPVRRQCLDYAVEHEETHGIWGGLSPKQRRPLVVARRAGESPECALDGCGEVVDRTGNPQRRYCSSRCAQRASSIRYDARKAAS